ncbi:unnamed protein product [Pocillopora meandrina]|uniref:Uncharacterized protein n=1 Tax=Pocillopora meandrina TaxID=46732 RepID=A0AAU9W2P9_9CNID|nr:unnamed protein product [Pocillopora meandrina]
MTSKCGKNKRGAHEGHLTLFMTRKIQHPTTEPVYSRGTYAYFPFADGFDLACDYVLVGCFGLNSENISVPQSILDGYFCGIFITSELYIPKLFTSWTTQNDLTS